MYFYCVFSFEYFDSFDNFAACYVPLMHVEKMLGIRPPLSKKSFPVGQVGPKTASREVGIFFFFFPNFNYFKLECTGGEVKKKLKN